MIGLYKTEVIRKDGPWKGVDDVEFATLDWVSWFNEQRLLGPIGDIPPAEFEQMYYQQSLPRPTISLDSDLRNYNAGGSRYVQRNEGGIRNREGPVVGSA